MTARACLGGWCRIRDRCPHYSAEDRSDPAERLCYRGEDGVGMNIAIVLRRPIGTWERALPSTLLAVADPLELVG